MSAAENLSSRGIAAALPLPDANLRPLFGPTFLIRDGSTGCWLGNHLVISYNEPGSCSAGYTVHTLHSIQQPTLPQPPVQLLQSSTLAK